MGSTPNQPVTRWSTNAEYARRTAAEGRLFTGCHAVHELPEIFHYWSNRYLRPKLMSLGFSTPDEMFEQCLLARCEAQSHGTRHFLSLGSGNCDLEARLALALRNKGHHAFVIHCLDVNAQMLDRGRTLSSAAGVAHHLNQVHADLNEWVPVQAYDGIMVNQSLHHVVNLERLFEGIRGSMNPGARFAICETIGRNGNRRWPEALRIVHEYWRRLPPSYRFNTQLERYEETFENWDCSQEGFEGIRAQDILPLLVKQFHFRLFVGYANVIEPFVDRAFGHNFDVAKAWDKHFIDEVQQRDEEGASTGELKPTQMIAVVGLDECTPGLPTGGVSPQESIRWPDPPISENTICTVMSPYDWHSWPHEAKRELEIACGRLSAAEQRAQEYSETATRFKAEYEKQLEDYRAENARLQSELSERTDWALELDQQLRDLRTLLEERTNWAVTLDQQVEERTAWALRLQEEVDHLKHSYSEIDNRPFRHWLRKIYRSCVALPGSGRS